MYAIRSYYVYDVSNTENITKNNQVISKNPQNYIWKYDSQNELDILKMFNEKYKVTAENISSAIELVISQVKFNMFQANPVITSYSIHYTKLYDKRIFTCRFKVLAHVGYMKF